MPRSAQVERKTAETRINMALDLDGQGRADVATGVGFFDHMLTLLAKQSLFDLKVQAHGDVHIDAHHTVEDVGIVLGQALRDALGDKTGIRRYGDCTLPMDETLVTAAVDLSGRAYLGWHASVPNVTLGTFQAELAQEFFRALAFNGMLNLHVVVHTFGNTHHLIEAIFKATGRALRAAAEFDPRATGIPSTKGSL